MVGMDLFIPKIPMDRHRIRPYVFKVRFFFCNNEA